MDVHKYCQSCGMPLAKYTQELDNNSDGSNNVKFCSNCYIDGKFTQPNITMEEMITQVNIKLREMKMPSFLSKFYIRKIPKLERWQ